MKKFLVSALTAVMLMGFGMSTEANQLEQENSHYRDYGLQYCSNGGEYCGRYGCGQGQGNNNG